MSLELEVIRTLTIEQRHPAVDQAARLVQLQETALNVDEDLDRLALLDRQFHRLLFEAAGVADLWTLIQSHSGHIERLRTINLMDPGKAANFPPAHRTIVTPLQAPDLFCAPPE